MPFRPRAAIRRQQPRRVRRLQPPRLADGGPLWPKLTVRTAEMLKRDFSAAGIPYVDDAGLFADFHALRHSYISLITAGGVHPIIAQRLARHSDINLTMTRYSHTLLEDEAKRLEALPQFPSVFDGAPKPERAVLRATGTDGGDVGRATGGPAGESVLPLCLPRNEPSGRTNMQASAVRGAQEPGTPVESSSPAKPPRISKNTEQKASEDASDECQNSSTPGRIRTCNPRFRRPMRYPIAPRAHAYFSSAFEILSSGCHN